MKLATILPPCAPSFREVALTACILSSYQMFLGQWVVKSGEYQTEVERLHKRGDFIILDNGAAEPVEERVPFKMIVNIALNIVDEIALPDELRDGKATIDLTVQASHLVPPRKRMIVPQGNDWDEWFYCLQRLNDLLAGEYRTIGIPKHLERLQGGRATALQALALEGFTENHDIHLLGVWNDAQTEISRARGAFPGVRGIDTGYPIAAAQAGMNLNADEWTHKSLLNDVDPNPSYYVGNISVVRKWCTNGA